MGFPRIISSKGKKEHMQRYAKRFFAEKLLAHGFVSYQDENLSWYRVINGEVLQSVYLFTAFSMDPILPFIGFGMTPLFVEVPLPQEVCVRGGLGNDERMTIVCMDPPRQQVAEDIWVQSTCSEECGAEKLDEEVFPILDRIHSISDAYEFYKSRYFDTARLCREKGLDDQIWVSDQFVDIAIYLDDKEMYPYCQKRIEHTMDLASSGYYRTMRDIERINLRYHAVVEGDRDMYLVELELRKKSFRTKLKNRVGVF